MPIVRDLLRIEALLAGQREHHRRIEAVSIISAVELIKAGDPRYRDPRRLLAHGRQYCSQHFEDGMIAEIFRRIGTTTRTFLEIGVGDGSENNTTILLATSWRGWWIEGDEACCQSIGKSLAEMPTIASRLKVRQAYVNPSNVSGLLKELGIPSEVDLFSLDIDLDTYHIWAALNAFKPRVVVVEYNGAVPPGHVWIYPHKENQSWAGTQQAFGASLTAFEQLGREFGYSLVGCDITGVNAFFVRDDLVGDHFTAPFTAENHYEPVRYELTYHFGHRAKFDCESHKI